MKRLLLLLVPACLSAPEEEAPMCAVSEDCDQANGEICDQGICWGNPPAGAFAAIVSPPSSRTNLAPRELAVIGINPDGWIDQLQLEKPITYSATLACQAPLDCPSSMLNATITVTRPSSFPGGPGFRSVVKATGGQPFQIAVPPAEDAYDRATYTVTIMPDGRDEMGTAGAPAQSIPPLRTELTIEGNATGKVLELGGMALPTISGVIKNDQGQAQSAYRVVAIGRWDPFSSPTEVSTVDYTGTDGTFQIQLSGGLAPLLEVVAKPVTPGRPTLRYTASIAQTGASSLQLAWPQGVGNKVDIEVPVKAVETNGEIKPARGARVRLESSVFGANSVEATYSVEGTTDDNGRVRLGVLDGPAFTNAGYRISIVPLANSTASVMYDQPFSIFGPIPERQLKTRVAIRGVVRLDSKGVKDMMVTARPSLRFVWGLDTEPQAFLTAIPPSVATTPESGEFVVWVDPLVHDTWGYYDLQFEAASGSRAPNHEILAIGIPPSQNPMTVQLGIYDLPTPAYVRSIVVDDKANVVEGAELKMYKIEDLSALCTNVQFPPSNCMANATFAKLMGRGASDETGEVHLTLPR